MASSKPPRSYRSNSNVDIHRHLQTPAVAPTPVAAQTPQQQLSMSTSTHQSAVASPGGLLLKSQMDRLRQESSRIRDDLQRFRSTIKVIINVMTYFKRVIMCRMREAMLRLVYCRQSIICKYLSSIQNLCD